MQTSNAGITFEEDTKIQEVFAMSCSLSNDLIERTISFHGHSCPGLMIGIRASELALREFDGAEAGLVAVVETDMCGVDAIQFLTGCTYGKGNLIHKDYGKMAFSFYDRKSGKGFRALLRSEADGGISAELRPLMKKIAEGRATDAERSKAGKLREQIQKRYMSADLHELFMKSALGHPAPRPARILESLRCEACKEMTMESRTRRFGGKTLCIPCFEKVEQKV
jgi:formylmethanofuran dehydrogenase subunit E